MFQTITMTAGQRLEFHERGDFLRLMAATAPVTVEYYWMGAEIAEAVSVGAGYAERFIGGEFDRVTVTSATAQTIQIATRQGNEVLYDTPPNGNVSVTNTAGAFTQGAATVTNASAQIFPARANRRYLLIQNKDATGDIFLNLTGLAATAANGVLVPAGGSYECTGYLPTAAIFAIGNIASNPNVVAVEG